MTLFATLKRLFALALVFNLGGLALHAQSPHAVAIEADYTWMHTNLLPGCNCFGLQGGSGEVEAGLAHHLSILADVTVTHKGALTPSGYALTQGLYTAGLRYTPRKVRFHPFGEALLGVAHASGTLSPSFGNLGSNTTFAFETGGGFRIGLGNHWSIVPVHAAYVLTTFNNGVNDLQNQLKLSAGLRFQFHR